MDIIHHHIQHIHRTTTLNITNSRPRLLTLKDLFDVVYGKYDLNNVCGCSFDENFFETGYCYPPLAPAPTPQIMIILNDSGIGIPRIDTRLYENDILKGAYGV